MTLATGQRLQTLVGAGVVLLALGLGAGAAGISSEAGYGGVGPNFLPWVVAGALLLCGGFLLYEAQSGGFRDMEEPVGDEKPYWSGFVWMSTGLLPNAALITTSGFIFGCTLCFVMAARGVRNAQADADAGVQSWLVDAGIGLLISSPGYWMFTRFLAISLPGITQTGWI